MRPLAHASLKRSPKSSYLFRSLGINRSLFSLQDVRRPAALRPSRLGIWAAAVTLLVLLTPLVFTAVTHAQCQPIVTQTPAGLTATTGKAQISLAWGAVQNATMYAICKSDQPNMASAVCVDTPSTSFTWTAPSVYNGVTYYFFVAGKNSCGSGPLSGTVSAKIVLSTPTVTVSPGKAQLTVNIGQVGDADKYRVCKSDYPGGGNVVCAPDTAATTYTWNYPGVMNGLTYNFFAYSLNAGGRSDQGNTATMPLILGAPQGVTAGFTAPPSPPSSGNAYLTMSWGAVPDADTYRVCWQTDAIGTVCVDNITGTSYTVTSSIYNTRTYVVQVRGQNAAGPGYWSAGVSTDAAPPPCPYACDAPIDRGGSGSLYAPSHPDPVNLATGTESFKPDPDISIYNPSGPAVGLQRQYYGYQAIRGYSSPGLSPGWVHTYDIYLRAATTGTWGALNLVYQGGASQSLTPAIGGGGQPTGTLTTPAGAPYFVSGVPGANTGEWQSVTVTWADQTQWRFTPFAAGIYALTRISNRVGAGIDLIWGSGRALFQVNDTGSGALLLSLSYASDGRLATVTDVYGRKVTYTFGPYFGTQPGMLQSVSQIVATAEPAPAARVSYTYTGNNGQLLATATMPSPAGSGNSTATINYDLRGRVTSLVDANGNKRVYTYNSTNTLVQVKDPASVVVMSWTQKFNTARSNTGLTDANGKSTVLTYTDALNPTKPTSFTDKNGKVTSYTYDQYGNLRTATTPRNVTTTYTYDYTSFPLGRLTSVQEGTKPATTFTYYEPSGLVQSVTSPSPSGSGTVTTTYTYDSLGNVSTVVGPGNNAAAQITTTYNYTSDGSYTQTSKVGQPLTITDNLGHTTHPRYDAQGRITSVTDAIGNETDVSYNLAGQLDTITLPATGQTGTGHGRRTNTYLYPGGPLTATTIFDESGAQVRQITYGYGAEGERLSISGSTEPVTYTYDSLYRLKTLKDGNNNTTTYSYNNVGLVSSVHMPGGETYQFPSYDFAGHLLQRVDGNGVTTNYLYNDAENLLTDIQYPVTPSLNVHFGYDAYGRRNSMTDSAGSHSYSYNDLDVLTSQTTTYAGLAAQTISYGYYPDGSRQTMTTPAGTFSYSYDAAGRPSGMTNPFSETTTWAYFDNGWPSAQTLGNGAKATYSYNALGEMIALTNKDSLDTLLSQFTGITHDGAGNRTSLTTNIPVAPSLSGTTSYQYDAKDQITQEQTTRGGGFTNTFGYDAAGNPTTFEGITKAYNSNNQQTGTGFIHDANGNPTTYNGASLSFDAENRLTAFGSALTAGYSGDGLRAWKQSASNRTYFVYDGIVPVVELDSAGTVVATNTIGVAGLISRRAGGSSTFYTFDPQGGVAQRLDASQAVLSSHQFAAQGAEVTAGGVDPFGYGARWGYYTDRETNLQLLTNRYYDPGTGRFVTRDPIGYRGGIDLYAYVRNDPVNFIDPLGQDLFGIVGGGSGGGAVGGLEVLGTASYMAGINTDCGCGDFTTGGAFSSGLAAGPYSLPAPDERHEPTNGGLGATFGGGGGLFLSNAGSFSQLQGTFDTTIISTPWFIGAEIDTSGDLYVVSITLGKGWGGGVFHMKTYTPPSSTWETQCVPTKQRPKEYWDTHSWGGGGRGW